MKRRFALLMIVISTAFPVAGKKLVMAVQVIEVAGPTPYSYSYAGSSSIDCTTTNGNTPDAPGQVNSTTSCTGPTPARKVVKNGYRLRLRLADGRIADVSCVPGGFIWNGDCHVPPAESDLLPLPREDHRDYLGRVVPGPIGQAIIRAEFDGDKVHLTWATAAEKLKSLDKVESKTIVTSETYRLDKVYKP